MNAQESGFQKMIILFMSDLLLQRNLSFKLVAFFDIPHPRSNDNKISNENRDVCSLSNENEFVRDNRSNENMIRTLGHWKGHGEENALNIW